MCNMRNTKTGAGYRTLGILKQLGAGACLTLLVGAGQTYAFDDYSRDAGDRIANAERYGTREQFDFLWKEAEASMRQAEASIRQAKQLQQRLEATQAAVANGLILKLIFEPDSLRMLPRNRDMGRNLSPPQGWNCRVTPESLQGYAGLDDVRPFLHSGKEGICVPQRKAIRVHSFIPPGGHSMYPFMYPIVDGVGEIRLPPSMLKQEVSVCVWEIHEGLPSRYVEWCGGWVALKPKTITVLRAMRDPIFGSW